MSDIEQYHTGIYQKKVQPNNIQNNKNKKDSKKQRMGDDWKKQPVIKQTEIQKKKKKDDWKNPKLMTPFYDSDQLKN
jgi:3-deoxy-D-manno-octulosonate 8-phosphate phosphatase KdsC-like HAD superfamily phosphatase